MGERGRERERERERESGVSGNDIVAGNQGAHWMTGWVRTRKAMASGYTHTHTHTHTPHTYITYRERNGGG